MSTKMRYFLQIKMLGNFLLYSHFFILASDYCILDCILISHTVKLEKLSEIIINFSFIILAQLLVVKCLIVEPHFITHLMFYCRIYFVYLIINISFYSTLMLRSFVYLKDKNYLRGIFNGCFELKCLFSRYKQIIKY